MGAVKYEEIYKDLKNRIESGEYEYQELIPSENTMVTEYSCSRNTVRRRSPAWPISDMCRAYMAKG
ncbi:GntR family transcriptional regulator [Clostridium sp. AM58-1XD]|uniref:GntR family transcriptional regulator n=1 Tax=Clostridium sp. AM58-1XD TaxID=2292307 RepID=UPI0026D85F8F